MNSRRLRELYQQHAAALVLYARGWCSAPDDAVQEAMLALSQCDPVPDDPAAWLFTTTKRRAMNIARAESRRQRHQRQAAEMRSAWFTWDDEHLCSATAQSLSQSVAAGLDALRGDQRELVVARVWGNLSFEQLGKLLGCSASSAHRRYQAALVQLRQLIESSDNCENRHRDSKDYSEEYQ